MLQAAPRDLHKLSPARRVIKNLDTEARCRYLAAEIEILILIFKNKTERNDTTNPTKQHVLRIALSSFTHDDFSVLT